MTPLAPATLGELVDAVLSSPCVLPVGARTKLRLSQVESGVTLLSTRGLRGIVEYDSSEFTFTALAGTPLREISDALAERGQYLPFDPMLMDAGATIGGTVASGLSGPGRFRYGGLRDFILGVRFVDGTGRLLRMGGKVVKNAAGFDLPKFFVGSLGRFGVLGEITFKVFPRGSTIRTMRLRVDDPAHAARVLCEAASARWELDALDASPLKGAVFARVCGPPDAVDALAVEIVSRFPGEILGEQDAIAFWHDVGELAWAHTDGFLAKIPLIPSRLAALCELARPLPDARLHVSAGGSVAYLSLPAPQPALHESLAAAGFSALVLRGDSPLHLGASHHTQVAAAVKTALDPNSRFPSLD
jgi:glycolate oxidase FAD binding subunit